MNGYLHDSGRTVSDQFHYDLVPYDVLVTALSLRLRHAPKVDAAKKSLFYGRTPTEELSELKDDDVTRSDYSVDPDLIHAIIGVDTEAAELVELLVHALLHKIDLNRAKLIDEAGDVLWYLAVLFRTLGVSFEEVAEKNLEKLRRRFPDKFTTERAVNRNIAYEDQVFAA